MFILPCFIGCPRVGGFLVFYVILLLKTRSMAAFSENFNKNTENHENDENHGFWLFFTVFTKMTLCPRGRGHVSPSFKIPTTVAEGHSLTKLCFLKVIPGGFFRKCLFFMFFRVFRVVSNGVKKVVSLPGYIWKFPLAYGDEIKSIFQKITTFLDPFLLLFRHFREFSGFFAIFRVFVFLSVWERDQKR